MRRGGRHGADRPLQRGRCLDGGPAGHGSALATGGYLIFWAVFTFLSGTEGGRPLLRRILLIAGVVHLVSAAAGLLIRWGILSILALPLALPAAVVFYGLRAWMGWTELYGTAALLSPAVGMLGKGQKMAARAERR